jgi:hypothetical protein
MAAEPGSVGDSQQGGIPCSGRRLRVADLEHRSKLFR